MPRTNESETPEHAAGHDTFTLRTNTPSFWVAFGAVWGSVAILFGTFSIRTIVEWIDGDTGFEALALTVGFSALLTISLLALFLSSLGTWEFDARGIRCVPLIGAPKRIAWVEAARLQWTPTRILIVGGGVRLKVVLNEAFTPGRELKKAEEMLRKRLGACFDIPPPPRPFQWRKVRWKSVLRDIVEMSAAAILLGAYFIGGLYLMLVKYYVELKATLGAWFRPAGYVFLYSFIGIPLALAAWRQHKGLAGRWIERRDGGA